jgi:hypothetical protein
MSADAEFDVHNLIQETWEKSNTVPRADIRHYCETQFAIPITHSWVDSFTSRHQTALKETESTPEEKRGLQVPRVQPLI